MILHSEVPSHKGACVPVWLNRNQIYQRLDGGTTGFFKAVKPITILFGLITIHVKHGDEFHGMITNGKVYSTEGIYS